MSREMKHSGIEWIGEIPKEWRIGKVKNYYSLQTGFTPDTKNELYYDDNGLPWVNISDIGDGHYINTTKKRISQYYISKYNPTIVPKGSLLYSFKLSVGTVAIAGIDLYTNEAIASFLQGENVNLNYLFFSSQVCIIHNANENIYGAKLLNQDLINNATILFPPLSEQQKIANYLDKVCGEVDEMIALQEQMIEELKAYKQSVITEAVTKGLNPNVPMHDSGIDWIGEIPEHWEVCRIRNVATLFGRIGFRGYTSDDLNKDGEGAITLSPSNMMPMCMDYSKVTYLSWKKYEESPEIMIQNNDLLMVKTGSSYGKVSYVDKLPREATINPQILRIVPSINSKYLGYYMQTDLFTYQVEGGVVGGTIPTISQEKIKNFYVILPNDNEQQIIASYLDTKCAEIDALIAIKQEKIEELKDYKKSVIYEYVTGKKEVV